MCLTNTQKIPIQILERQGLNFGYKYRQVQLNSCEITQGLYVSKQKPQDTSNKHNTDKLNAESPPSLPWVVKAIYLEGQVQSHVEWTEYFGRAHVENFDVGDIELTGWPHIGHTDSIRIIGKVNQPVSRGRS